MTETELKCPECGESVPATGISSATGIGDAAGNISFQPHRSHSRCPKCGTKLVRNVEPPGPWQRQPD